MKDDHPSPDTATGSPVLFLALGDSYTVGEGVAPEACWPHQVAGRLRAEGWPLAPPVILARTGWSTADLLAALPTVPAGPYDLVSVLIGVNDQYRGGTPAAYRPALSALLEQAVARAGGEPGRVVVISIPDWSRTPFATGRDRRRVAAAIAAFNRVNRAEAARCGAAYVDITPLTSRRAGDPAFLAPDGLHPSGRHYAEWAQLILPTARSVLT
ncbi:hypothetical protein AWN76_004925 [Rhodothermaceae bacterium RA]|nr:hypothetical protein AWN76_004925 [Rhodothermaceae bacterium RA]